MQKKERITRRTADEIEAARAAGATHSDWARAAAATPQEIEAAVADDPDEVGMEVDWSTACTELPQPKTMLNMRVDRDVLEYFRRQGRGYQTRINAVLRSYVAQMSHRDHRR